MSMSPKNAALAGGAVTTGLGALLGAALGAGLGVVVADDFEQESRTPVVAIGTLLGATFAAAIVGGFVARSEAGKAQVGAAGAQPQGELVGAGLLLADGDYPVPDPLHSDCTITLHCTTDSRGRQHCTSTRTCP